MVRIKNPTALQVQKRMSVRVPLGMVSRIEENLLASGYNKKQRFFWFEDILNGLFSSPDYHNLIAEEFITAGTTKVITLSISTETYKKIEETVTEVLTIEKYNTDKSSIIRTAIIQRLLKASGQLL
jgi:hypothetical protein